MFCLQKALKQEDLKKKMEEEICNKYQVDLDAGKYYFFEKLHKKKKISILNYIYSHFFLQK